MSSLSWLVARKVWQACRFVRQALRRAFLAEPADRRAHPRFACSFPVEVLVRRGQSEHTLNANSVNISRGGILLEAPSLPGNATRMRIAFSIQDEQLRQQLGADFVRTDARVQHRCSHTGLTGLKWPMPLNAGLSTSPALFC